MVSTSFDSTHSFRETRKNGSIGTSKIGKDRLSTYSIYAPRNTPKLCCENIALAKGAKNKKNPKRRSGQDLRCQSTGRNLRPDTGDVHQTDFLKKFDDSYRRHPSLLKPRRGKRISDDANQDSKRAFSDIAYIERSMMKSIEGYRRTLSEHHVRIQSQACLVVGVPVIRVLNNLIIHDVQRNLRASWTTWKQFISAIRLQERHQRLAKKHRRTVVDEFIKLALNYAVHAVSTNLSLTRKRLPTKNESKIQKWYRSRSVHKLTCLDPDPGGRMSHFGLPDLTKYKSRHANNVIDNRIESSCSEKEVNAQIIQKFWKANCEQQSFQRQKCGVVRRTKQPGAMIDTYKRVSIQFVSNCFNSAVVDSATQIRRGVLQDEPNYVEEFVYDVAPTGSEHGKQAEDLSVEQFVSGLFGVALMNLEFR